MAKSKRKIKKFTKAEREKLGLDKVPDTMYDTRGAGEKPPLYPEYEPMKPRELDFEK